MARPSYWVREPNPARTWPHTPLTIFNESFGHAWPPGETIIRTFGNLRMWVSDDGSGISNPGDLYASYLWGLVWDDGSVPNMDQMSLHGNMTQLEEHILHIEGFSMRDAHTPAGYAGVNIGFIDDRPNSYFETRARRLSAPTGIKTMSNMRLLASVQSVDDFFGINFRPRINLNVLTLEASTL